VTDTTANAPYYSFCAEAPGTRRRWLMRVRQARAAYISGTEDTNDNSHHTLRPNPTDQ
jgi:hypothetical protein